MAETNKDKFKEYELIIYGATGFTGQIATQYIDKNYPELKWAIAGRNKDKLTALSENCSSKPGILIGNALNKNELDQIAKSTKVILSFAGPFNKYSNSMVDSCFHANTHYVDITGENIWVKDLIDKYHSEAVKKNIKIIPSCGYDSIPSDIGVFFSQRELKKPIKKIDCYHSAQGGVSGGTIESGFSMMEYQSNNKLGHTFLLNPKNTYTEYQKQKSKDKFTIKKIKDIDNWSAPFVMAPANTRVVRRSSAILDENQSGYGHNFVYNEFMSVKKYWIALAISASLIIFGAMLSLPFRRIFRPLFTKPGNGPSVKAQNEGWFKGIFIIETEDGKKYKSSIYGDGDPGYKSTARFACESALCLIKNTEELPNIDGGVLTSATGLGNVLVKRLSEKGVVFEKPSEIR